MAKILVVEDNEMLQEILSELLVLNNHEAVVAGDGEEGVALTEQEHPDLILMDMGLPVLDGWEATKRIKANGETAVIPIIALTAHALADDQEKSLAAGCDDYETKPLDFTRLLAKIEKYLSG